MTTAPLPATLRRLALRRQVLWPALLALVGVGVTIAVVRAWAILTDWSAFTALDRVLPAALLAEGVIAERWYADHGQLTLLHIIPGALFLAVLPTQFVDSVRRRRPMLHRWVGRTLVAIGVPVAVSGLVLGGLSPFGGVTADAAIFLFGVLFLVALSRGFLAARGREFGTHREWMLRAAAIGAGIATVRVVAFPLYWVVGGSALALVGPTFWLGLGLSAAVAEWWIWHSRRGGHLQSVLPN